MRKQNRNGGFCCLKNRTFRDEKFGRYCNKFCPLFELSNSFFFRGLDLTKYNRKSSAPLQYLCVLKVSVSRQIISEDQQILFFFDALKRIFQFTDLNAVVKCAENFGSFGFCFNKSASIFISLPLEDSKKSRSKTAQRPEPTSTSRTFCGSILSIIPDIKIEIFCLRLLNFLSAEFPNFRCEIFEYFPRFFRHYFCLKHGARETEKSIFGGQIGIRNFVLIINNRTVREHIADRFIVEIELVFGLTSCAKNFSGSLQQTVAHAGNQVLKIACRFCAKYRLKVRRRLPANLCFDFF